ncbi:phage baseplate assembly protein V [Mangrovicoccus ximenensis]|uniref:phage baseplate assembly protein V n=1 Tax=Mangrovicoccus ximenensis TaxID=1911570 RepID=UPI0011AE5E7F|nr:phage baseplate assembly protein V [Mangrovicoccus ximenensis]
MAEAGLALGRVIDTEDPEGLLRIRVQRLDRPSGVESDWMEIVRPMASDGAGVVTMPEIDDVAVIAHVGTRPMVLGFVYSGTQTPPVTDVQERVIQTPNGHRIVLADNDADGITIADAHGNEIVMNSEGITITSAGKIAVSANSTVELEASATTTIKGATVELNP